MGTGKMVDLDEKEVTGIEIATSKVKNQYVMEYSIMNTRYIKVVNGKTVSRTL